MTEPTTAVYMTIMEQEQYVKLIKYFNVCVELDKIDFFKMKGGSVELHKDRHGNLSTVIQHIHRQLI